jgi:hypothetical protein
MPGGHERFKNTTGCHTSALGELFISSIGVLRKGKFLRRWSPLSIIPL